ncbi:MULTISPECIES: hypothetical protein [Burkholderia]|jgi:hypothetical protein|uniref:Lipoprotein n=1 Tax=Burkholderia cenocepacia TaxID=95486 RepID=A0ABD4U9A3_9BURK|nr:MULTISPECIES: hypothetical protein [Burkholderia]AOK37936.1 hypothetical protein WL90_26950 [Burkholderia cenocepacia]AQQ38501.1 hypothetical protein A8E75_05595 [Burkholderia cenocepacia]KWF58758.1 hypothetical protein WL89_17695 [Burkholderia cenocepacia]MBG0881129.1 hypothetical protein [Burkholderia sp. 9775_39]MBG0887268.1 hypothetical protein [Burkholderia sp. 9773_38]
MPRAERPDGSPARQPKPSWGPGKNAALSVAAFAAIFGAFAYVERDTRVGHASVTHDIARVIGNAVGKSRELIVAATGRVSGTAAPAGSTSTLAQAGPVPPSASAPPAVSAVAEPAVPPQTAARSDTTRTRPAHVPPTRLAANPHAASTGSRTTRPGDTHRTSRSQTLARTRKHPDPVPKPQPQSYVAGTSHMEATSVTHDELEGARALAKARWCARIDEWSCVEQNASRALAIDPKNSESRALLGQAIRNRL